MRLADKITISRLALLPFVWIFALLEQRLIFVSLLLINLLADGVDGYVARKIDKKPTKFGAKLDAYADFIFGASAMFLTYLLVPAILYENKLLVPILIVISLIPFVLSLAIFKKLPSYHLISNKINSIILYGFMFHTLLLGYNQIFLYILGISVILNVIEKVILLSKKKMDENIKSVFSK
jgi:CDP-diacylglycerol--glycerol-3-phosphate 3-phosphatidyltransferase